jgi:hypothetical protein
MDGSGGTTPQITMIFNTGINRLLTPVVRLYGATNESSNYVELFGSLATQNRTINFPDASGTVALTSNLSSYLPLSGGTLTGALNGTSATFSGVITANDNIRVYGAHQFWFGSGFRGQIVNYGAYAGTTDWSPFFTSETSLAFGVNGNATKALNIASTGAATFSSSVSATSVALNGSIANSGDAATLTIKQTSTSYNNGIYLERGGERNGYHIYIGGAADSLTFRRNYFGTQGDVMSLTRDGNVGIGTASALQKFTLAGTQMMYNTGGDGVANTVIGSITSQVRNYGTNIATNSFASIQFATDPSTWFRGDIRFLTNGSDGTGSAPTERVRITSGGVLINQGGVYDTSSSVPWIARQGGNDRIIANGNGYVFMPFLTTGSGIDTLGWWGSSGGSWGYNGMLMRISSSARYKKNIRDLELDTTKIFDLRTISYENNENTAVDGLTSFGLLAEDVAEKIPKLATYNDKNQPEGVQYNMLSVLLLEEVKKLKAELEALKNK